MSALGFSLHRDDEEDLVDYDDSEAEAESVNGQEISAAKTIGDIDIFEDGTDAHVQKDATKVDVVESTKEPGATTASRSPPTMTKTTEAATVIKSLDALLTNSNFRAALGLIKPGSALDLDFWSDGLDFALSLKLVGAAQAKACKYRAECRNKKCTFDHGSVNCATIIAGEKPRKLCSMVNTLAGCPNGNTCWFSHEASGVGCADGDLRATCVKGFYCVYKHNDDEVVAAVDRIEQSQGQANNGGETNETETHAQSAPPAELAADTKTETAPPASAPRTAAGPKQQAAVFKRGRDPDDEAGNETRKTQRVYERRSRQELLVQNAATGGSAHSPADSYNRSHGRRVHSQPRYAGRGDRGCGRGRRGGRGGRGGSDTYRPYEGRQHAGGQDQSKKVSLKNRMSRG